MDATRADTKIPIDYDEGQSGGDAPGVSEPAIGAAFYCWSDARRAGSHWVWQPLVCHGLDAAACADAWLGRAPEPVRRRLATLLGVDWVLARPWLLLLIACHDIGKACPGYQSRWRNLTGIDRGRQPDTAVEPAFVGQIALRELLQAHGWAAGLAAALTDAVVCHGGRCASTEALLVMQDDERSVGGAGWSQARRSLFEVCHAVFRPPITPTLRTTAERNLPLLLEAMTHAEAMASDEAWFPFANTVDLYYPGAWYERSRRRAQALVEGAQSPPPD